MREASDAAGDIRAQLVRDRRDLHRVAEPGWCEVYTAARIVAALRDMGCDVRYGESVVARDARLGLPPPQVMDAFHARALDMGADPHVAAALRGGFTGVVARLTGGEEGPVVAFRFDLDANFGAESQDGDHPPRRDGYASTSPQTHHNCGHDGHAALGLALARAMTARRDAFAGELRLIFQPAEEGLRGARAMVAAGVLDGVETFVAAHIGVQALSVGEIVSGYRDLLGSVKLDAAFSGRGAHAALSPHEGRNALLAACVAAQNLMAIPRHGAGDTRINVGMLSGGDSRNTVPSSAQLALELRSENAAALDFLKEAAQRVVEAAAQMHGVTATTQLVGESCAASSDPALAALVREVAAATPGVRAIRDDVAFKASEDAAEMMRRVQESGGLAVYLGLGSALADVHHAPRFDFDEATLPLGLDLMERLALKLLAPR